MGDMADWATDNGLMPEDEWVISARENELEAELHVARAALVKLKCKQREAEARLAKVVEAGERMAAALPRTRDYPHSTELAWRAALAAAQPEKEQTR